jgi:hypothetical protein
LAGVFGNGLIFKHDYLVASYSYISIHHRYLNLFKKKLKLANFSLVCDSFLNMLEWVSSYVTEQAITIALWQQ